MLIMIYDVCETMFLNLITIMTKPRNERRLPETESAYSDFRKNSGCHLDTFVKNSHVEYIIAS